MDANAFRYDGKRALVVGGATGMGAATALLVQDLGADVVVMDHVAVERPGMTTISVDLGDEASIDAAVDECGGPIHALFSCAGVADGTPGIEKINFIGHRHLINRALAADLLPRGSAIGMISSAAGLSWEANLDLVKEYLDTPDFDSAVEWIAAHGKADYMWSKQAMCGYVARESLLDAATGHPAQRDPARSDRHATGPANADMWLTFGADFREATGVEASTPEEQAGPLAFLCSDAAAYINGVTLITDAGYASAGITSSFPDAKPVIDFLYGRY